MSYADNEEATKAHNVYGLSTHDIESSYTLSLLFLLLSFLASLRVEKFVAYNINNILLAIWLGEINVPPVGNFGNLCK